MVLHSSIRKRPVDVGPTSSRTSRITCIAFDAVGTLIYAHPHVSKVYHDVARKYGSRLSEQEIGKRFAAAFRANEIDGDLGTNEERERRRWQAIVGNVLDDVGDAACCFEELFAHFAHPTSWACYDDVSDALCALDRNGYRLAVASNFDRRLENIVEGISELQPLSIRIISSVVGYRKPSREFYRALIDAAGCRPEEILMVGDDETNDVQGAQSAGLPALRLDRCGSDASPGRLTNLRDLCVMLGLSPEGNLR